MFLLAYQLNRPEQKDGIVIAFRRGDCNNESIHAKLYGLSETAAYEVYFEDYGIKLRKTGRELMNEFNFDIPQKPASLLIRYYELPKELH